MDLTNIISENFKPEIDMYSNEQILDLTELLKEVGPAHHQAFIETDGYDLEWPMWYADFMHDKIMDILDVEFTKSELIFLLVSADLEHQDEEPESDWPPYYAKFLSEGLI